MKPSVWFVIPAAGRLEVTRMCLAQLRRTCDTLDAAGVRASAVVIADDENLDTAMELGFGTVRRENNPLGRKWNDGYELAARAGVDYVMPLGSDDWIDPALVLAQLESEGEIRCARLSSIVSEDGRRIAPLRISYDGGDGVRMIPTKLLERLRYRPCEEDRHRALDTSVMRNLTASIGRQPRISYADVHQFQIVDFKSSVTQLNDYRSCLSFLDGDELDAWETLEPIYGREAVDAARALYPSAQPVAA